MSFAINSISIHFAAIKQACKECRAPTHVLAIVKDSAGGILASTALCPKHCGEVIGELDRNASKGRAG